MNTINKFRIILMAVAFGISLNSYADEHFFTNVTGYTLNSQGELLEFSSIHIKDDKVARVGSQLKKPKSVAAIDMKGAVMLPGIIDAHGHILGLGGNLIEVDLRGTTSEKEAVARIKAHVSAEGIQDNGWIIGRGWNQVLWPNQQFPTKASLDKAFPDTPVMLSRIDGHADWVNSKALEIANINQHTSSPSGGEIIKDDKGLPTGLLIDNASNLINAHIPKATTQDLVKRLNFATDHLLSLGITSAHDAGISEQVRDMYIEQAESDALRLRIYAMISATDPNIEAMLKQGHYGDEQGYLSIRSVKAYGDGALGSRGAALLAPYSDDPHNSGLLVTPEENLPTLFNTIIGAGFQLNFHAIGDRANRLALLQFAKTFETFSENTQRHRIEHAQVIAPEDIPLFKEYGIIPSMQPTHATSDMNMAEDRLGKARLKGAYAWQTFLKQGSPIAFGSDFPVELANPFHGLHAAITRQDANQQPENGWINQESVSRKQALRGFTLDAAYSGFQEHMIGSLEVGKKADFIIIDRDIFAIEPSLIRDTRVLQTWVNGKRAY